MPREGFSVEYFCYENVGYSPKYVDELYDVLQECAKMVRYYLDTSATFPNEIKADINRLSTDLDNLFLDFNITYTLIARMVNEAKREFFLSKKIKANKRLAESISKKVDGIGKDLEKLIENARLYMKKVHEYKA